MPWATSKAAGCVSGMLVAAAVSRAESCLELRTSRRAPIICASPCPAGIPTSTLAPTPKTKTVFFRIILAHPGECC